MRENIIHALEEINTAKDDNNKLYNETTRKGDNKRDKVKYILKETLLKSTCHGLPNFVQSKVSLFKFIWLLTTFVFTGVCSYFIIEEFVSFFNYHVNSHTRKVYEMPTTFPTVTVCNKNMFTTEHALNFIKQTLAENNLTMDSYFRAGQHMDMYAASLAKNYSDSYRQKLSKPMHEFILSCRFDDEDCNIGEDFVWLYDKNYGNCFKFNSDLSRPKLTTFPGKFYGLMLTLDVQVLKELMNFSQNIGAVIKLDNGSNELDLPVSFETNIVVDRVYARQMMSPYSLCNYEDTWPNAFNSDLFDTFRQNLMTYSQKDCIELCYQNLAVVQCRCLDRQSIPLPGMDYCYKTEDVKCLVKAYESYKLNDNSYVYDKCMKSCPLECNNTNFQMSSSFSQLSVNSNVTVKVNIFYETLSYLEITESEAMTVIDLVSSIGGIMGLFLGVSFMSFMEFFEMLFRIGLVLLRDKNDLNNI